jgi:hypothetical protein
MEFKFLLSALVLSEMKNAELQKRIDGFEMISETLSNEVDRLSDEIKQIEQLRYKEFSFLKLVA